MSAEILPPVIRELDLDCSPTHAFDVFTSQLARWWPLFSHSCFGEADARVEFEPFAGGKVVEINSAGERAVWGTLLEWNPPRGFSMTWHPGQAEDQATVLEVRFESTLPDAKTAHTQEPGCRLTLIHQGWAKRGETAGTVRDSYATGWVVVLELFEAAVK
ncbi:MAG: SRPBCC domain-containing protein [Pseudomonadales bacterium]|nr:SRPBCC domain-containing protein [Pseudomonadales bacterium]MCP5183914.1 SRPBCC domain-containing protein [Pseudomonadales bacterium]